VILSSLADIERLYAARGEETYGEGVSQAEHAVQCAALAEAEGAAPSLVAAALLHDIGHLLAGEGAEPAADDRHEALGARALAGLFGPEVRAPIALHVTAKRYLCLKDGAYLGALSPASRRSLAMQGGPLDAGEAATFEKAPSWREAVSLRRLDDRAKSPTPCGRAFSEFMPLLRGLARAHG
jgi:phosphonate degradation associated HDIG domain protein